jgi:RNA polymerase sigma factor (sigma-70 family)
MFVQAILRTQALGALSDCSDGELIKSFVASKNEAAFEALARRHAAMVWGVCRRTLGNDHDAEDAFQATFIVLSSKAASIKPPTMVGNWLYGVARRAALKARQQVRRRRLKERQSISLPAQCVSSEVERLELREALDEALARLPAKYRVPIVLCDLEGLTRSVAAQRLGWPEGTVSGRLARARDLLARQLIRRGLGLSVGTATGLAFCPTTSAGVPPDLLGSTLAYSAKSESVCKLASGVMRSMFLTTFLRTTAAMLLLTSLIGGAGLVLHRGEASQDQPSPAPTGTSNGVATAQRERTEAECIAEMYAAAKREWDARMQQVDAGVATLDFLANASRRLLQAELEKSRTKAERVAALEAQVRRMERVEQANKLRFESGNVSIADLQVFKFFRSEAELKLIREKQQ